MIRVYNPWIASNQVKYVLDCLQKNMLSWRGEYEERLEEAIARYLGVKHAICVTSGTTALDMMYRAWNVQCYSVITSNLSYIATISSLRLLKVPVYVIDCDDTLQMDLDQLDRLPASKDREMVVVPSLYGSCPNMDRLVEICKQRGHVLLEDSAQSFGCWYNNRPLGTWGEAGVFSFFANKIITAGEGGVVVTNNDDKARWMRLFRNHNTQSGYRHSGAGTNYRMTNIQAAIALAQLEDLPIILRNKRSLAEYYRKELSEYLTPVLPRCEQSNEWLPLFRLPATVSFEDVYRRCIEQQVEVRPVFPPLSRQDAFFVNEEASTTRSRQATQQYVLLPGSPGMSEDEWEQVVRAVRRAVRY